ncbi:hypothetical protein B0H16DRAFT_1573010 [Mycena metata]|uniref:Uncharacterized protein n=1 Tax=Mycena metata TaxID=1033252 RepID=A0AAD7I9C6_9AGAR|nr:hypothetical protein B0H16DRAFT_1573010 [Mycena metata]
MPSVNTSYKWQLAAGLAKIAISNPPGQTIDFEDLWEEVQNNAANYCRPAPASVSPPHSKATPVRNIIGTRFLPHAKQWLRTFRYKKLLTADFEEETLQLTPKGYTKFTDIRTDVGDTSNMDEKAVVAAYFFASKKHIGSLKSLTKPELDGENVRLQRQNGILRNENATLKIQVENLQGFNAAGPSEYEQHPKYTTPRKARSEGPYQLPTPVSIPRDHGRRVLSSPPSPSPHGSVPMDVDDDDDDDVFLTPKSGLSRTNSAMTIDQSGLHPQPSTTAEEDELIKLRAEVVRLEAENACLNERREQDITKLEECQANVKSYEDLLADLQNRNAHIDEDLQDEYNVGYFQAMEAMKEANDRVITVNNDLTRTNTDLTSANEVLRGEISAANIRAEEANASMVQLKEDNTALEKRLSAARNQLDKTRRISDLLATAAKADSWETS